MKKIVLAILLMSAFSTVAFGRASNERNALPLVTQSKVFSSGVASDVTVDVSNVPVRHYSLQASESVNVGTWDVRLEGSLDNINFTQILQHVTTTNAPNSVVSSGTLSVPMPYLRLRLASIAANSTVTARFIGM